MPLRVAFHTLGCKLNQLETDAFAEAFARAGAIVAPRDPDLVFVNTCTVTAKADAKARRLVRLALAADPEAVAIITGCSAELEAEALSALSERALVVPGGGKEALLGLPAWLAARGLALGPEGSGAEAAGEGAAALLEALREWLVGLPAPGAAGAGRFAYNPAAFAFHSRPALKVQDGCDNDCAYCRVRIARGRCQSLAAPEALSRARELEEAGRAEIVLTGVNLSQYRDGGVDFPALLDLLIAGTERIAFRVSSYEPDRIDSAFLGAFAHPRVRPHVHLAAQSGADPVLAAMGRRYGRADVLAAVRSLRLARGDPFIGADFIVGFPGETEGDATATLELARECDFAGIQVYRFSPRPGTPAASFPNRVPDRQASERADALTRLGLACREEYITRWRGAEAAAVLERGPMASTTRATTDNYLKLTVRGLPEGRRPGQAIICRIDAGSGTSIDGNSDACALYIRPDLARKP